MGISGATFLVLAAVVAFGAIVGWLVSRYDIVFTVPVDGSVEIDQPVTIALEVPIEMMLTQAEIDLSQLELPLDTDIFVAGMVDLDTIIPIATDVTTSLGLSVPIRANVPIKANVPIRQHLHVRERLKLDIEHVHIPVKTKVPVEVCFALRQTFRVSTTIQLPIRLRSLLPSLRSRSAPREQETRGRDSA